ncbi:Putative 30 kDa heat shock protein [Aspergillus calidoustus]|uniref:Putative 30 kDa heat shock protein n=1 Tax=Aspergillus calidoustus TaxID=454130 RepID=A0A0U4ZED2_ASPCI|nr:Putative 30 kDa heat shock protein [Aspergillus calidoustus]
MSLFRTIPTASDFSPLFRLLDDYDNHRSTRGQGQHTSVRSFAPRFDVRETKDAYLLDGELPGIAQKDIDIEFTDPQTLVVKGRSEREYHSSNVGENTSSSSTPAAEKQPQVEDAPEGEGTVVRTSGEKQVAKHTEKPRYWVSERSVGEFQRTFSFPSRVDQDAVKASLKDGILSVLVPKAAPPSSKKIAIQ